MSRTTVIDCDPGTDDAIALLLAFGHAGLSVPLVTVAGGNAGLDHTLANARALVGLARVAVPIVAGADRPLLGAFAGEVRVHGEDGIGGVRLPEGPAVTEGVAADAIRDLLRAAGPDSVTLVGLGPATNLALALATEPGLVDRVAEIVLMTGAVGEGNATPSAEFNAWSDPEALAMVLGCGRPITLATLDLTAQALCTPARIARLGQGVGKCREAACAIMASVPPSRRLGLLGHAEHDACAIAWLLAPGLFTARPVHVEVDLGPGLGRGRTVVDRWGRNGLAPNARLLETLDADGFFGLLDQALARLP